MFLGWRLGLARNLGQPFSFWLGLRSIPYPLEVPLTVACSQLRLPRDENYMLAVFYKDRR